MLPLRNMRGKVRLSEKGKVVLLSAFSTMAAFTGAESAFLSNPAIEEALPDAAQKFTADFCSTASPVRHIVMPSHTGLSKITQDTPYKDKALSVDCRPD